MNIIVLIFAQDYKRSFKNIFPVKEIRLGLMNKNRCKMAIVFA